MDDPVITIKVTEDTFNEFISIDQWMSFNSMTNKELYDLMVNFVVDENGASIPADEAKKLFRQVKKKEWTKYVDTFFKAVSDAFVSPMNGGG